MRVLIVDCGSDKVPQIAQWVNRFRLNDKTVALEAANGINLAGFQAVIISGGPHLLTEAETFSRLMPQFEFIKTVKVPLLGICLGHQAIGIQYGASVYKGEPRRDKESIRKVVDHPLLAGLASNFEMQQDHCEGIDLAPAFKCLARSAYYPVEAMCHQTLPVYSVQFHPEVSQENGRRLLKNFFKIVEAAN
ncbi:type 1 glutamine amidotransferase [Aliikangiella sp. IMCC44632]